VDNFIGMEWKIIGAIALVTAYVCVRVGISLHFHKKENKNNFGEVNNRIVGADNRITNIDNRVTNIDKRINVADNSVSNINGQIAEINSRVGDIGNRIIKIEYGDNQTTSGGASSGNGGGGAGIGVGRDMFAPIIVVNGNSGLTDLADTLNGIIHGHGNNNK